MCCDAHARMESTKKAATAPEARSPAQPGTPATAPAPPSPSSYQPKGESPSTSTHCPRRKAERLYIEVNVNEQEVKMSV